MPLRELEVASSKDASTDDGSSSSSKTSWLLGRARRYCQWTSLHGFNFLAYPGLTWSQGLFWAAIIAGSIGGVAFLVAYDIQAFVESTVSYDLATPTHPLDDVFFPSLVICNMNQLRSSFIWALVKDPALRNASYMRVHQLLEKAFIKVRVVRALIVRALKLQYIRNLFLGSGHRIGKEGSGAD